MYRHSYVVFRTEGNSFDGTVVWASRYFALLRAIGLTIGGSSCFQHYRFRTCSKHPKQKRLFVYAQGRGPLQIWG
ncbi:hypothetical protein V2G26_014929 [Clonostachys chloroleuca]